MDIKTDIKLEVSPFDDDLTTDNGIFLPDHVRNIKNETTTSSSEFETDGKTLIKIEHIDSEVSIENELHCLSRNFERNIKDDETTDNYDFEMDSKTCIKEEPVVSGVELPNEYLECTSPGTKINSDTITGNDFKMDSTMQSGMQEFVSDITIQNDDIDLTKKIKKEAIICYNKDVEIESHSDASPLPDIQANESKITFRDMAYNNYNVFNGITLEEALDIVNDDNFASEIHDDCDTVDVVILPPDPDSLTDEDEAPGDATGIVNVNDVPGPIEVHFAPSEKSDIQETTGSRVEKSTKKRKLCNQTARYEKCAPKYTKIPKNDHASNEKWEEMKKSLKNCTPLEIGEKILNYNGMFELIVKETLSYAASCKNIFDLSFDPDELRVFLGILLLSGYHRLPSERHYWSEEPDLGLDIVKNAMSRNQYLKVKSFIHFNNSALANDQKQDKGFKVRPLISMLNASFQQFGIFSEQLAIDGMIVKYYGHNSLKQLIRGKPIRFGYKMWSLCGSNGYCYKFDLYCGKDTIGNETNDRNDLALGSKVILNMLDGIDNSHSHDIYFDNFFTSRDLLLHLQNLGFRATGTVRENRLEKCPLQDTKALQQSAWGSYDYMFDIQGEILFVKWHDNKCVTVASNFDVVEPVASVSRWNRNVRQKMSVQQPLVIKHYSKNMGGVDHHDRLAGKYATSVRGKKWYWALFTRILDMAVVNGWIIYREIHGRDSLDLLEFRRCLAVQYLKMFSNRKKMERTVSLPHVLQFNLRFDGRGHFMAKRSSQRHCQMEGCKGRPTTFCKKCDVTLCQRCFEPYHSR